MLNVPMDTPEYIRYMFLTWNIRIIFHKLIKIVDVKDVANDFFFEAATFFSRKTKKLLPWCSACSMTRAIPCTILSGAFGRSFFTAGRSFFRLANSESWRLFWPGVEIWFSRSSAAAFINDWHWRRLIDRSFLDDASCRGRRRCQKWIGSSVNCPFAYLDRKSMRWAISVSPLGSQIE